MVDSSQDLRATQRRRPPSAKPSSSTSTGQQERLWPLRASAAGWLLCAMGHGSVNESMSHSNLNAASCHCKGCAQVYARRKWWWHEGGPLPATHRCKTHGSNNATIKHWSWATTDKGAPSRECCRALHGVCCVLWRQATSKPGLFLQRGKKVETMFAVSETFGTLFVQDMLAIAIRFVQCHRNRVALKHYCFFHYTWLLYLLCCPWPVWQPDPTIINQDFLQHAKIADRLLGHYCQQWRNRQCYWLARTRAQQVGDLCTMMIDSYDKAKCMLPKYPHGRTPKQVIYESVKRIWSNFSVSFLQLEVCLSDGSTENRQLS